MSSWKKLACKSKCAKKWGRDWANYHKCLNKNCKRRLTLAPINNYTKKCTSTCYFLYKGKPQEAKKCLKKCGNNRRLDIVARHVGCKKGCMQLQSKSMQKTCISTH